MNKELKLAYKNELSRYRLAATTDNLSAAWTHLERAHILGQYYALPHLETHWLMFKLACSTFNLKEFFAQIPRLILAVPGSLSGKAPKGNPGSARVGIFTPTNIPADLEILLQKYQ